MDRDAWQVFSFGLSLMLGGVGLSVLVLLSLSLLAERSQMPLILSGIGLFVLLALWNLLFRRPSIAGALKSKQGLPDA